MNTNNEQIHSSLTIRVLWLICLGELIALGIVNGARGSVTGWLLAATSVFLVIAALRGRLSSFSRVERGEKKVLIGAGSVGALA